MGGPLSQGSTILEFRISL